MSTVQIHLSIYLSILYIYQNIYLSIFLSISLFIYLSIYLSLSGYPLSGEKCVGHNDVVLVEDEIQGNNDADR